MNNNPMISVVLPVYNAQNTIKESIDSIITQSYTNWEMILINDGSSDSTMDIVKSYKDERIKVYNNEGNKGLIYTLNRGVELATGKYIARMDSDDIALPLRFEKQIEYMESNPKCIICGTFARTFSNDNKKSRILKFEVSNTKIKHSLICACCFAHPTVMIRTSVFQNTSIRYDENYPYAEDHKLWIDLMHLGEYHNIPEVLLRYRVSGTQMSQSSKINRDVINNCHWHYLECYLGEEIVVSLRKNPISLNSIKFLDSLTANTHYIKKAFYLSLDKYSLKEFCYLFTSFDVFKYEPSFLLKFLKRMVVGKAPIIYS